MDQLGALAAGAGAEVVPLDTCDPEAACGGVEGNARARSTSSYNQQIVRLLFARCILILSSRPNHTLHARLELIHAGPYAATPLEIRNLLIPTLDIGERRRRHASIDLTRRRYSSGIGTGDVSRAVGDVEGASTDCEGGAAVE